MKYIKKLISFFVILAMILPMSLVPIVAEAEGTVIFSDGFGTGNSDDSFNENPTWTEGGNGAEKRKATTTGNDTASPDGGRFAIVYGTDGWICRTINASGYNSLNMSFFWRGDDDAEKNDKAKIEYKVGGNCTDTNGWADLYNITDLRNKGWQSVSDNFPANVKDTSFAIRFRTISDDGREHLRVDGISISGAQMVENTLALCTDKLDNDGDGFTDLDDSNCTQFKPTITVNKLMVNDNGGTMSASDFTLRVGNTVVNNGVSTTFDPGTYTVNELPVSGYYATYSGDCDSSGTLTMVAGQNYNCTITNNDLIPHLTLDKIVSGGDTSESAWTLTATGPSTISGPGTSSTGDVFSGDTFQQGTYTLSESGPSGYNASSWSCAKNQESPVDGSSITLELGDTAVCTITNTYVPPKDVCPNIDGTQTEIPAGMELDDQGNCVTPSECTPNATKYIYSEVDDNVDGGSAVATWIHPNWTSIPSATWIWHEAQVSNPTSDETDVFTKDIQVVGDVTSASIDIATDNGYMVKINGTTVVDNLAVEKNFSSITTYDIKSYLQTGSNTLEITVKNFALAESTYETNPAGLLYKITLDSEVCPPPTPTTATIVAQKIICPSESLLPNWGDGEGMSTILSDTASQFISANPTCRLSDWTFEWAPNETSNPGDNTALAGGAWTSFTSSVQVPGGSKVWVREKYDENYVPFSSDINSEDGWNDNSAEMYCHTDVYNYDNYDFVDPVEAGQTYYCVAFNADVPPPTTSTVQVCKVDSGEKRLSGWTVMLKGNKVQDDLIVPANIHTGVGSNVLTAGTSYIAESIGTWLNKRGTNPVDAEYSTNDGWVTHVDGETEHQTDSLELQINKTFDPNSNWGAYNSAHKYAQSFVPSVNGPANFRMFDGTGTKQEKSWFADNSGSLTVDIYEGYSGITGENGCVTFEDVPYGRYALDEILQDDWTNVSGLETVSVDETQETFYIMNRYGEEPVCEEGYHQEGDACVQDEEECDDGYHLNGDGRCVTCDTGYTWNGEECVVSGGGETDLCTNLEGIQTTVPSGMTESGGICSSSQTGGGEEPTGGNSPMGNGPIVGALGGGLVLGASTTGGNGGGEVLGASCGVYLNKYIRFGSNKNDVEQVKKLQEFLNKWLGANLPVTGYYGSLTLAKVKEFQLKYKDEILKPWDLDLPTGLVYLSTTRTINNLECPDLMAELPELVPWSQNPEVQ